MLEMPSIESDFSVLGGVDFNLLFCYEIPRGKLVDSGFEMLYSYLMVSFMGRL